MPLPITLLINIGTFDFVPNFEKLKVDGIARDPSPRMGHKV